MSHLYAYRRTPEGSIVLCDISLVVHLQSPHSYQYCCLYITETEYDTDDDLTTLPRVLAWWFDGGTDAIRRNCSHLHLKWIRHSWSAA